MQAVAYRKAGVRAAVIAGLACLTVGTLLYTLGWNGGGLANALAALQNWFNGDAAAAAAPITVQQPTSTASAGDETPWPEFVTDGKKFSSGISRAFVPAAKKAAASAVAAVDGVVGGEAAPTYGGSYSFSQSVGYAPGGMGWIDYGGGGGGGCLGASCGGGGGETDCHKTNTCGGNEPDCHTTNTCGGNEPDCHTTNTCGGNEPDCHTTNTCGGNEPDCHTTNTCGGNEPDCHTTNTCGGNEPDCHTTGTCGGGEPDCHTTGTCGGGEPDCHTTGTCGGGEPDCHLTGTCGGGEPDCHTTNTCGEPDCHLTGTCGPCQDGGNCNPNEVPEPASLPLAVAALLILGWFRRVIARRLAGCGGAARSR